MNSEMFFLLATTTILLALSVLVADPNGAPVVAARVRLIVGSIRPELNSDMQGNSRWLGYDWRAMKSGQIAHRPQCVQFMEAATDSDGRFTFRHVKKNAPWYELFHTGRNFAPSRYPDLSQTHGGSLGNLVLSPVRA